MAKFFGAIGFESQETEIKPGVWKTSIVERQYYGDVVRNTRRTENEDNVNANLTIGNSFEIVADPYAQENFHAIRYIMWMGKPWSVTSVEVRAPRLLLRVGGLYNGPKA